MTNNSFHYVLLSLLSLFLLNIGSDEAHCGSSMEAASNALDTPSQSISELQPPEWHIGDSWVVETEIFDQGNIMKRSDEIGWTEKQAWRFKVLGIDGTNNHRCYHLQISPINGNACPYHFMFWLRVADLQVNAFQIIYPADDYGSNQRRPRSIRKQINETQTPDAFFDYFKTRFPSLPLWLIPQFNNDTMPSASSADTSRAQTKMSQKIVSHSDALPSENAAGALPYRETATRNGPYHKVTLVYGDTHEIQYWEHGRPWPVYGYKSGKNGMEKLYRLTQIRRMKDPKAKHPGPEDPALD
ncbi:MAG: hypothetical protein PVG41_06330 [Desulfobacteraceae bacterium]|jgi:hypothetical protein